MGESTYRNVEGYRSRIIVLGSGNVATHLAIALDRVADVVAVWSRTLEHAVRLADKLRNAVATDDLKTLDNTADFYIISVTDDAIDTVAAGLQAVNGIVAHTSGSFPLNKLTESVYPSKAGVFYPLQTFSRTTDVNLREVPFLIEGTTPETTAKLTELAKKISDTVHPVDSLTRGELHIAAVFANNFANYAWDLADRYLRRHTQFDITVFRPLLAETLRKAMTIGPHKAQTGPARRNDTGVIDAHLAKLDEDSADVYRTLTNHIIKDHQ